MTAEGARRGAVVPLFILACLLLGGSTRSEWLNMLLQLGAIALLAWSALAAPRVQSGDAGRLLMRLIALMVIVVLVQLIPLPPGLWSALPGRAPIARGYDLLSQPRPWLPLSLAPYDTMTSALWLLPPLAVIAAMLRPGAYREGRLAVAVVGVAIASVILGALQLSSGAAATSPYYFYAITNDRAATGFFANSNHLGTLLICAIPFAIALIGARRAGARAASAKAGRLAIAGGVILTLLIGVALDRSWAAIALCVPVIAASLCTRRRIGGTQARWVLGSIVALLLVAIGIAAVAPIGRSEAAFGATESYASRRASFGNSLRATADLFPIGSGSGSFAAVYPAYEDPDRVTRFYVNHVHDDYIELALETGVAGMLLIGALLLWWAWRTVVIWRAPIIDPFARAATIASGAILVHSLVDFPLRTSAIAALFAACLALMAGPRRIVAVASEATGDNGPRHLSIG